MRIALLGPLRLTTSDGVIVPLGGARLRMLLARLALDPGRFVPVGTLVDGLWGTRPPADAGNALQSLVFRLRRTIRDATGTADLVLSGPAGYQLAVTGDDVDVTLFDRLAGEGRAHLRAGRPELAERSLAEALRLWQGTQGAALAEVADAPFVAPVAARLAEAWLGAAGERCEALLTLGRPDDALAELDHLVAAHPLREGLVALRMRALAAVGRTADALADFDRTRQALVAELGVDPSAELADAHLAVLRGRHEQPSGRTRADPPAPLTSFVGRDVELADARTLLAGNRLVSLVGAGGAGKTRLAVELAARMRADLPGRVWFVELAPVRTAAGPEELAAAVLSALDVRDVRVLELQPAAPKEPLDRLVEHVGRAPALLVLDNCEHLVAGAAELAETLLRRCPALSVLATTREPLAVTGETGYRVGPLDLPAEQVNAAEAEKAPAVRLFVDRAVAARPGFVLDDSTVHPVVEICRRLDGLPLALELAAARLRAMNPHQIAALLDDRFRLLTVGSRTSLPRHRTLRGVVEWSWDLLTEPERVLARRLAVLPGGADAESAAAVCADDEVPAEDVPYLLASLVEKSLLTVVGGQDDRPRYRMLETVRAYGLAELVDRGEVDRLEAAFVRHVAEFVERVEPGLRTKDQLHTLSLLAAEHDNVSTAMSLAVAHGDADHAARLVTGMAWYWTLVGNGTEAASWAAQVVALPTATDDLPAVALLRLALLLERTGGAVPIEELERLLTASGAAEAVGRYPMLGVLEAIVRMRMGDVSGARVAADRMVVSADAWARAAGRLVGCLVAVHSAEVERAEELLRAALAGFREIGERWGTAFALGLLGQYQMMRGDQAGAVASHEEAVRIADEVGARNSMPPIQLIQLGAARGMAGDLDAAERDVLTALAGLDDLADGDTDVRLVGLCVLIHISVTRGDLDRARSLAAQADTTLSPDYSNPNPRSAVAVAKSTIALAAGEWPAAAELLADALEWSLPVADMSSAAGVGERIAVLVGKRGEPVRAAELLGAAAGIRGLLDQGEPNVRTLVADLTAELGEDGYRAAFRRGFELDRDRAVELLREAVRPA